MNEDFKKEFEWQRHLLYQILINQEKHMATLQEALDAITKLSADFDAYKAAHQTTEAADLDQVVAAVAAVDAKVTG
jgi:hypothetical protein